MTYFFIDRNVITAIFYPYDSHNEKCKAYLNNIVRGEF